MEKSPAAHGMGMDEYADVSLISLKICADLCLIDDVAARCWDFEKEETKCTAIACDGIEIKWGVDAVEHWVTSVYERAQFDEPGCDLWWRNVSTHDALC